MKKILAFIVLIFTLQFSYALSTSYIRVIQSVQPLSAANISDSGNLMVFIGTYSKTQQGIFLSQAPLWQNVKAIVVTGRYLPGTKIKLQSFLSTTTQNGFTDFNGPVVSDNTVAFAAMTNANRFGVFYAEPGETLWETHKVALVGDQFQKGLSFTSLSAPYTFQKQHLLFLAKLSNGQTGAFSYDIQTHLLSEVVSSQHSKPAISDLSDVSVNQGNFAIRGLSGNKTAIYIYNGDGNFTQASPLYKQLPPVANTVAVGRPGYFQVGDKSYVVFPVARDQVNGVDRHYNIVGNISSDAYSTALVSSGDAVPSMLDDSFDKLSNPSLTYQQDIFYFTFEGTTQQLPGQTGAYLAKLDHNTLHLLSLVNPAIIFDGGKVNNAMLGAVSIRNNNIPVSVAFKSGYYGIYLFQLKD